jgi:hypothetical protein
MVRLCLAVSDTTWYPSEVAAATTAALKAGHAAMTTGVKMQTQLITCSCAELLVKLTSTRLTLTRESRNENPSVMAWPPARPRLNWSMLSSACAAWTILSPTKASAATVLVGEPASANGMQAHAASNMPSQEARR